MYGKWFESVYEGSLAGKGPLVIAVWGYCCAKADPEDHTVLLNPEILAAKIGGVVPLDISGVIEFLCSPDPLSQCKDHEGRRLLPVGGLRYFVVTHEQYRNMTNSADRREYMRQYMRDYRKPGKHEVNRSLRELTPASASANASVSRGGSGGNDLTTIKGVIAELRTHDSFAAVKDVSIENALKGQPDRTRWGEAVKAMLLHYAGVDIRKPVGALCNYLAGRSYGEGGASKEYQGRV